MPKNKTHSGMKKRIKRSSTGKLQFQRAGKRHLLERKSSTLTRRLTGTQVVSDADATRVKKMLGI